MPSLAITDFPMIVYIAFGLILLIGILFAEIIFWVLVAGVGILIWKEADNRQKHLNKTVEAFAEINNFSFKQHLSGSDVEAKPGTLFDHGHSKYAERIIEGMYAELPFTLFEYHYATGSGKRRRDYQAMVMEFELPRTMPHMIIDSVIESNMGSILPIKFDKSQKIELEGDFHKYFDLYAPDKYGVSALTILAPDAMDALLNHAGLCDIEIINNRLYFYWPMKANNPGLYKEIFETSREVLAQTGDKLKHGDIFGNSHQAKLHTDLNGEGVRLKKTSAVPIIVFIIAIYALSSISSVLFKKDIRVVGYIISYLVQPIVVITLVVYYWRRQKLREEFIKRYRPK